MKKEITKRQRDALVRHMPHHTATHMKKMLAAMEDGKSFFTSTQGSYERGKQIISGYVEMKVLELFKGSESVGKVATQFG